jgi:hypothetical protein
MIPESRCRKAHHRHAAWQAGEFYYPTLKSAAPDVPWLFGLPRYFHRLAVGDFFRYLKAMVQRRKDDSFFHELRVIRYLGLCYQAWRHRLWHKPPPAPAGMERPVINPVHSP